MLITSAKAAHMLSLKPNTLEVWRTQGRGPAYRKIGRLVRYVESDVLAWLDLQKRWSTTSCSRTENAHG